MNKDKQEVNIKVATPNGVFTGVFEKTTKIKDVITAVVHAMNLAVGELFELVFEGKVLQPVERPLVSFGISDSAELDLVATGSGV